MKVDEAINITRGERKLSWHWAHLDLSYLIIDLIINIVIDSFSFLRLCLGMMFLRFSKEIEFNF